MTLPALAALRRILINPSTFRYHPVLAVTRNMPVNLLLFPSLFFFARACVCLSSFFHVFPLLSFLSSRIPLVGSSFLRVYTSFLLLLHPLSTLWPLSLSLTLSLFFSSLFVSRSNPRGRASGLIANIISSSSHKRGRSYLNDCLGVLTTPIVYEVDLGGHTARGKSSEAHW